MEAAGEKKTAKRRPAGKDNRIVFRAGAGVGGGGLLLLGGALTATAMLGVAFFVRAATRKAKGSPREAKQEKACDEQVGTEEGENREGFPSLLLPPPPPPPSPSKLPLPPQGGEGSCSKHGQGPTDQNPVAVSESGTDDSAATTNLVKGEGDYSSSADDSSATAKEVGMAAEKSDSVQVQEKVIEESSPMGRGQGEGEEDSLPHFVNKDVVVDEPRIIQMVEEESASTGNNPATDREEKKGGEESPVEKGTDEIPGKTGDSTKGEADPAEVTWPAKAIQRTLTFPSLGLLHALKPLLGMAAEEKGFQDNEEKVGGEQGEAPWKDNRGCVVEGMAVETKEKGFSRNAQVLLVLSMLLSTTVLAIWLYRYSSGLLEASHA